MYFGTISSATHVVLTLVGQLFSVFLFYIILFMIIDILKKYVSCYCFMLLQGRTLGYDPPEGRIARYKLRVYNFRNSLISQILY